MTPIATASKLVFACLVPFVGCGGKSHTTDDDALGGAGKPPSVGGVASSSAGSSTGGTLGAAGHGTSRAGNASTAGAAAASFSGNTSTAGTASSAGTNSGGGSGTGGGATGGIGGFISAGGIGAAAEAACSSVCSRFNTGCEDLGSLGSTCQSDCSDIFAIQNGACTELGVQMMSCLRDTIPSAQLSDCWIRFYDVSQRCYLEVDAYKACVAASNRVVPPTLCAKVSASWPADAASNTVAGCKEDRKCLNGLIYAVDCHDTTDQQSLCTCKLHERTINDFVWQASSAHACQDALPACLALASTAAP